MWKYTILFLLLVAMSGCSTLIHGAKQSISVTTTPPGATVKYGKGIIAETPTVLRLRRSDDYVLNFSKDGYKPQQVVLDREFNGVTTILGNILWLLPGFIVDFVVGGAWSLNPDHVEITLELK